MNLLWFLLLGLVAGWLAGKIMKGGGYGVVGDIVIGVIGSLIGGQLLGGLIGGGLIGSLITATLGAVLLIFVIRLVKRA
ncbi:MAG TPA: GlsB/YeaQ/YmgE family stress response membrane protein [Bryobacteraceae bacterium]|jgi:uncharacterized membrane protein YeaQ/YmgE (transglycosylase-associated protein family)